MNRPAPGTATDTPARFGASADIRFGDSLEAFVEFVTGLGLNHVELRRGYLDVTGHPPARELRALGEIHDVTFTVHAPHVDVNLANVNDPLRDAAVEGVKASLDFAAAIDAGGVVVHGGSIRRRYPDRVNQHERAQAVRSLRSCVEHADDVGVPLCLENQRETDAKRRNTATPERLAQFVDDVGVESELFKLTLDVGHAKATGVDYEAFVDRFGDRIQIAHLHDNDGTDDDHDPLPRYEEIADTIDAPFNVLEMKSLADIERCVRGGASEPTGPTS